jgi:hypothetical protein
MLPLGALGNQPRYCQSPHMPGTGLEVNSKLAGDLCKVNVAPGVQEIQDLDPPMIREAANKDFQPLELCIHELLR